MSDESGQSDIYSDDEVEVAEITKVEIEKEEIEKETKKVVKSKYNPWLIWAFMWYVSLRMRAKTLLRIGLTYFGQWAPLWTITNMIRYWHLDRNLLPVESEDGDILPSSISHVEYVVKENFERWEVIPEDDRTDSADARKVEDVVQTYHYDITARSIWYLYCIGDSYTEFMEYTQSCMPYAINEEMFNNTHNNIVIKYIKRNDEERFKYPQACTLTLRKDETCQYTSHDGESNEDKIMYNTLVLK